MITEIHVHRIKSNHDATLSMIRVDGQFMCFGLEDEYRDHKVAAETRIPNGRYQLAIRDEGGFHQRYKERFEFHQGMIQVMDVPGFEYILIHIGNTDEDTAGCLLVGAGCSMVDELTIQSSTHAYRQLYNRVIDAVRNGDCYITYIDEDLHYEN